MTTLALLGQLGLVLLLCMVNAAVNREKVIRELVNDLSADSVKKIDNFVKKNFKRGFKCEDDPALINTCPHWKHGGACENNKETMKQYCKKTCDLCKPPAQPLPTVPECAKTQFGCCWDNVTAALGPVDNIGLSQCRPCANRLSELFCNNWKTDCGSKTVGQGDFMRSFCPTKCGVPCDYNLNINKCRDDPANLQNCNAWYADGKCTTEQAKMRVYCPAMCGFCLTSTRP